MVGAIISHSSTRKETDFHIDFFFQESITKYIYIFTEIKVELREIITRGTEFLRYWYAFTGLTPKQIKTTAKKEKKRKEKNPAGVNHATEAQ